MTNDRSAYDPESQILIYDGDCRLCAAAKQRLEQSAVGFDRQDVRFVPYQSHEAKDLLGQRYRPGRPAMAFLVGPAGEVREGLDAFLPFLATLPGGNLVRWLLRVPFGAVLARWGYQFIARHRYRIFGAVSYRADGVRDRMK